jgi:hypothetical protein
MLLLRKLMLWIDRCLLETSDHHNHMYIRSADTFTGPEAAADIADQVSGCSGAPLKYACTTVVMHVSST